MAGIFVNYRRDDAPGVAGRLFDRLSMNFAQSEMFMDVDAMKPGLDFVKQLDEQVSKCSVMLAIIGPGWLNARDEKGRRRLDLPRDSVRVELASALKREIPVIPLLVNGTAMPSEDDLPDDLKPLANRHGLELRHSRFAADSDAVIVKGLISMLIRVLSGHTPDEISETKLDFIREIGMMSHLAQTRSNGLLSMIKQMKNYALAYKIKSQQ